MKKRILATALCASMVLGSTMAFADEPQTSDTGNTTGQGEVEGIVKEKSVWSVTLPTSTDNVFDFILDPQDLIKGTSNAAYSGGAFETGKYMFFETATNQYNSYSKELEVVNESSFDVNISVSATLSGFDGISLVESSALSSATDPSMHLELVQMEGDKVDPTDGTESDDVGKAFDTNGTAELTSTIAGVKGNFEIVYDNGAKEYKYQKKTEDDLADWNNFKFYLTGEINSLDKAKGWADLETVAPTVNIVWTVEDKEAAEAIVTLDACGTWVDSTLWLSVDESTGFTGDTVTVEASLDGVSYRSVNSEYTNNWVGVKWTDIQASLGDSVTEYSIRVTDGTTRYVYSYPQS